MDLAGYQRIRDDLLARLIATLEHDPRVAAAWLVGSFGRGDDDAWSDLDLHLAIEDEAYESFLADRPAFFRRFGEPLLVLPEIPSNAMPGSTFQLMIYPGPVEVDWNIGPVGQVRRVPETTLLFARREIPVTLPPPLTTEERQDLARNRLTLFWAMAPIAVKYAGRSDTRSAVGQIKLLAGAFVTLWRLLEMPDGPHPMAPHQNRATEPALDAILPRFNGTITPEAALDVIRALCRDIERWHPAFAAMGIEPPDALAAQVARLADLAEREIQAGPPVSRPIYR